MHKEKSLILIFEFICVFLFSLIFGIGMGWLFMRTHFMLGEDGANVGGAVASILGITLYYTLVRRYLTIQNLGAHVGCCSLIGLICAEVSP
jgi:hypothetical protein